MAPRPAYVPTKRRLLAWDSRDLVLTAPDERHPFDVRIWQRFRGRKVSEPGFITCWHADRLACSVGLHPSFIWPNWWRDAPDFSGGR